MQELILSTLGHTWIFDLDGTIVRHNGYQTDGFDTLLPGVKEFFAKIPPEDMIMIVTSRTEDYRELTEEFLLAQGIRYDCIVFGAPYGERILVNDTKPSGLKTSISLNVKRDQWEDIQVIRKL